VDDAPAEAGSSAFADLSRWGEPVDVIDYLGIFDALYVNGWARLELPAGARVDANRLRLPAEYGAAGGVEAGWFLRDEDGWLSCELPEGSECLGDVVLVPPPGARAPIVAARPEREEPAPRAETRGEPDATVVPAKRSAMDRFRSKKQKDKEPEAPPPEPKPAEPAPPAAEAPPADKPAATASDSAAEKPADAPEAEDDAPDDDDASEGDEEPADAAPQGSGDDRPAKRRGRRKKK
jgi:hypothetical protein